MSGSLARRRILTGAAGFAAANILKLPLGDALTLAGGRSSNTNDAMNMFLATLAPGQWGQPANTTMRPVAYSTDTSAPDYSPTIAAHNNGSVGPAAVFVTWTGGAYDSVSNRVLCTGGGHVDYFGNELYGFDYATLKWARLTTPSDTTITTYPNQGGSGHGSAGFTNHTPCPPHSYGGELFVPSKGPKGSLLALNNAGMNPSWAGGSGCVDVSGDKTCSRAWWWDASYNVPLGSQSPPNGWSWTSVASTPTQQIATLYANSIAGYDPVSNRAFKIHGLAGGDPSGGPGYYDVASDTFADLSRIQGGHGYLPSEAFGAMRVQPRISELWGFGVVGGGLQTGNYKLDCSTGIVSYPATFTNNTFGYPAYYAAIDQFLMLTGVGLMLADPVAETFTAHASMGTYPTGTSGFSGGNGLWNGRWNYDPVHHCFVLLNNIDQNVWIWKPDT